MVNSWGLFFNLSIINIMDMPYILDPICGDSVYRLAKQKGFQLPKNYLYDRPTLSALCTWLRKTHQIHIIIDWAHHDGIDTNLFCGVEWLYRIRGINYENNEIAEPNDRRFVTVTFALKAGIREALSLLNDIEPWKIKKA